MSQSITKLPNYPITKCHHHSEVAMRKLIGFWIGSLLLAAGAGAALTAQGQRLPELQVTRPVLSGADIGFRIEDYNRRGEPIGRLVVRVDGEWVEAHGAPSITTLR
jgi:hypothetical protein